jgi:hypothetical protein
MSEQRCENIGPDVQTEAGRQNPAAALGFVTAPDAIHNFGRKFRHCSAKTATTTKD